MEEKKKEKRKKDKWHMEKAFLIRLPRKLPHLGKRKAEKYEISSEEIIRVESDSVSSINQKPSSPQLSLSVESIPTKRSSLEVSETFLPKSLFYQDCLCRIYRQTINLTGFMTQNIDIRYIATSGNDTKYIQELHMMDSKLLTDTMLQYIGELSSLRKLSIRDCPNLEFKRSSMKAFKSLTNLTHLSTSGCAGMNNDAIQIVMKHSPKLIFLDLSLCQQVSNQGMFSISERSAGFSKMTELDITGCDRIDDNGLLPILMKVTGLKVIRFGKLKRCTGLMACHAFSRPLNVIETLDLHQIPLHFSALSYMARGCRQLVELNVSDCLAVNDTNLADIGKSCWLLESLKLRNCDSVTDDGIIRLSSYIPVENRNDEQYDSNDTGKRCFGLKILDITGCYQITSVSIKVLAENCRELEELSMNGCHHIDSVAYAALARYSQQLRSLKCCGRLIRSNVDGSNFYARPKLDRSCIHSLGTIVATHLEVLHMLNIDCDPARVADMLTQSSGLTDLHIGAICNDTICQVLIDNPSMKNLRSLNVSQSQQFTESKFFQVLEALVALEKLNVQQCRQLGDVTMQALADHCAELRSLNVGGNWRVSDQGVVVISEGCLQLEHLNVDQCPEVSQECLNQVAIASQRVQVCQLTEKQKNKKMFKGLESRPRAFKEYLDEMRRQDAAATRLKLWLLKETTRIREKRVSLNFLLNQKRIRNMSATTIQRVYRGFVSRRATAILKAKLELARKLRQNAAAIMIQKVIRGYLAQLKYYPMRDAERERLRRLELVKRMELERVNAIAIQRTARGFLARQLVARIKQEKWELEMRETNSAIVLQRYTRGMLARIKANAIREFRIASFFENGFRFELEFESCLAIQRTVRGFLGRCRARDRRIYLEELAKLREKSATQIQKCFRAFKARVTFRRRLFKGSVGLQKVYRGFRGRNVARMYLRDNKYFHPMPLLFTVQNSIFNQRLCLMCKEKYESSEIIARVLQAQYRGYSGRLIAIVIQGEYRHIAYRRQQAALKLTRFFRHIVISNRKERLRAIAAARGKAARQIQSVWRMWVGKYMALAKRLGRNRRYKFNSLFQSSESKTDWQRLLILQRGAVYTLVVWYRSLLKARGWTSQEEHRMWNRRATLLQAVFRGHHARAYTAYYRYTMNEAANVVQRGWASKKKRQAWKNMLMEARMRKKLQDEEDRAGFISRKITNRYALELAATQTEAAVLIQRMYRMLKSRHMFLDIQNAHESRILQVADERLHHTESKLMDNPIFEAELWDECFNPKPYFPKKEDEERLEQEKIEYIETYRKHFLNHQLLMERRALMEERIPEFRKSSKQLMIENDSFKDAARPFAVQSKEIAKEGAQLAKKNKSLRGEIIRLKKKLQEFHKDISERLSYDPVIYGLDIDRVLSKFDDQWNRHSNHLFGQVWEACIEKHGEGFDTEKKPDVDEMNDAWTRALRRATPESVHAGVGLDDPDFDSDE